MDSVKMKFMKEEWTDMPGFEGVYQSSNLGRLKRLERVITPKDIPPNVREEWADIPGFEGIYQESNFYRVKCLEKIFSVWMSHERDLN